MLRRLLPLLTILGWTGSLILAWATPGSPLRRWELSAQGLWMQAWQRLRPVLPPDQVVIVAIDNDSLNVEGRLFPEDYEQAPILESMTAWPWPRAVHAELTRLALAAGARAVVFDVVFSTQSAYGPSDDHTWQHILATSGSRVVLGANYSFGDSQVSVNLPHADIVGSASVTVGFVNTQSSFGDPRIFQLSANLGIPEGIPVLPSLAEAALEVAGVGYEGPPAGAWIYYFSQPFREIPYYELLVPSLRQTNWRDGEVLRDKIVLVGATADTLQDFHQTPLGRLSGPQIQAHQIGTLLENRAIVPLDFGQQLLVLLGIGLLGGGLILRWQRLEALLLSMGAAMVGVTVAAGVLLQYRIAMPNLVTGNLILLGIGVTEGSRRTIQTQLEKLKLRRTLDRYVSGPVAAEIMSQPEDFTNLLRGRKRQVAVLFSDIRGFTTLSSELPPEALIPQLNQYLTAMVAEITACKGCIDKFIGDAIMAEFGSPTSEGAQQDALNAVTAALQMRARLAQLRQQWQAEGLPPFFAGIGINFGDAVAGSIGSQERSEYTVLGDTVNVASRVESLTKDFATDLIITESTYDLVAELIETIPLGKRRIRGRSGETGLFQVIGRKGNPQDRQLFQQVHQDYLHHLAKTPASATDESLLSSL
ncbi:MAG: adenylate/guanylate cyclase domain-containing protein [Thermostichales cyanobacterium BF4_bins_65]